MDRLFVRMAVQKRKPGKVGRPGGLEICYNIVYKIEKILKNASIGKYELDRHLVINGEKQLVEKKLRY